MTNISKHPCGNKCTDFKDEQCKTCLVGEREEQSEAEFLVGDAIAYLSSRKPDTIQYVKTVSTKFEYLVLDNADVVNFSSVRHATIAELNANRRLTDAEMALGEVS